MSDVGGTLVVEFGDGADASEFVAFEFDETLNLDADGNAKTSYSPGDEVWFWLQHDVTLRLDRIAATSGMVVSCGTVRRSREQELIFTGEDAITLSHVPSGNPTFTWYGNVGSGISRSGRSVSVSGKTPCVCDAVIPIEVRLFRFIPPPLELEAEATYKVKIVAYMEAA